MVLVKYILHILTINTHTFFSFLLLKSYTKNELKNNTELSLPFVGKGLDGVRSLVLVTGNVSDDLLFFGCLLPI